MDYEKELFGSIVNTGVRFRFKRYVENELCYSSRKPDEDGDKCWVFWSQINGNLQVLTNHDGDRWASVYQPSRFRTVFLKFLECYVNTGRPYLVQVWVKEGQNSLTTKHLPFTLCFNTSDLDGREEFQGLCKYRMICKEHTYALDDVEGIPGRAFRTREPEYAPNLEVYDPAEHPLLQKALDCRIISSMVYPVFELDSEKCVGVFEIVSTSTEGSYHFADMLPRILKKVRLTIKSDNHRHIS